MSEENVEIVRGHIDAFRLGDPRGALSHLDPNVEMGQVFELEEGRLIRGRFYLSYAEALEAAGLSE